MIRFLPGFVAAIAAWGGLKLAGWVDLDLWLELALFLTAWIVVAAAVDRGMRRYGASKTGG